MQWFRWVDRSGAIDEWNDFTQALHVRFSTYEYEDPTGLLAKLRQTSSVQDYQGQFETLANRTEGLNESFMVSCFVAGLKEEIRLGVQMFTPNSLFVATNLARLQEEKNMAARRIH